MSNFKYYCQKIQAGMKYVVFFCLIFLIHAFRPTESSNEQQRQGQKWTDLIFVGSNQNIPAQYFMCGFAFRKHQFHKLGSSDCGCSWKFVKWKLEYVCNICLRTFDIQSAGFKGVFCKYNKWSDQIQRTYSTSSPYARQWKQINMCPPNHFINGFSYTNDSKYQIYLGFHGLKARCQTLDFKQIVMIQDSMPQRGAVKFHSAQLGNFISGYKIKIKPYGAQFLIGLKVFYEPIPIVSDIKISYNVKTAFDWQPIQLDYQEFANCGDTDSTKKIGIHKNVQTYGKWILNDPWIKGYDSAEGVYVSVPNLNEDNSINNKNKNYNIKIKDFGFNDQIKLSAVVSQEVTIVVSPGTLKTVSSNLQQKKGIIFFTAVVTFSNSFNNKQLMKSQISGVWEGVTMTNVKNSVINKKINCENISQPQNNQSVEQSQKKENLKKQP